MATTTHIQKPTLPFEEGIWWVDELGGLHSGSGVDESFHGLFFRHLGQVRVSHETSTIAISWDVREALPGAILSTLERLEACPPGLGVDLHFYYFGWVRECHPDAKTAIQRILQVQENRSIEVLHSTSIIRQDISACHSATSAIKRSFLQWERTGGDFKRLKNEEFSGLISDILIFRPDSREQDLVFSHIGNRSSAARVFGRKWVAGMTGQLVSQPFETENQYYVDRANVSVYETLKDQEPRLDHVLTLVHSEDEEPYWLSYERLVTSHSLHDGSPAVVSMVMPMQNAGFPFAGGP